MIGILDDTDFNDNIYIKRLRSVKYFQITVIRDLRTPLQVQSVLLPLEGREKA